MSNDDKRYLRSLKKAAPRLEVFLSLTEMLSGLLAKTDKLLEDSRNRQKLSNYNLVHLN